MTIDVCENNALRTHLILEYMPDNLQKFIDVNILLN